MKQISSKIIIAILLGIVFSCYFFKDLEKDVINALRKEIPVTAFQVGAFSSLDDAKKCASKYSTSTIYHDEEIYRVLVSILSEEENVTNMKKYFQENNEDVYLKTIHVNSNFFEELEQYELIVSAASTNAYDAINEQILKKYEEMEK